MLKATAEAEDEEANRPKEVIADYHPTERLRILRRPGVIRNILAVLSI